MPQAHDPSSPEAPVILVPEIRDYQKINAELVNLLDQGYPEIRLEGAESQRLLVSGLNGPWQASILVTGKAGPEFAANLNAPGLTVGIKGAVADGAGSGLRGGRVIILGGAGDAAGYAQTGGLIIAFQGVGHRAGLRQSGGSLIVVGGSTGRLPGERQSAGRIVLVGSRIGAYVGRGRTGGVLVDCPDAKQLDPEVVEELETALGGLRGVDLSDVVRV